MDFDDIDFENRIVDPEELPDEFGDKENPLRPKNLDEYIGQEKTKKTLKIYLRKIMLYDKDIREPLFYYLEDRFGKCRII